MTDAAASADFAPWDNPAAKPLIRFKSVTKRFGDFTAIDGIGPDQLRVKELLARLEPESISEMILCTNPNIEGEATAMYLARLMRPERLRCISDISPRICTLSSASRLDSGSSNRNTLGWRTMARPMATR